MLRRKMVVIDIVYRTEMVNAFGKDTGGSNHCKA